MKSIQEFLHELTNLDIELRIESISDDPLSEVRLRCNAPKGILTSTLREELARRKDEIITFLNQSPKRKIAPPIQPVSRAEPLPLSFAQQRLWFLDRLEENSATYNDFGVLRIKGALNLEALEQSFREIIRRHEVLRTTFPTVNGIPVQKIAPNPNFELSIVNCYGLSSTEAEAEIQRRAIIEARRPFDLTQDPLLRAVVLQFNTLERALLLINHHMISDGWSRTILIRELTILYEAFCQGRPSPLEALNIQYADFACWQQQWLEQTLESQLAYWKQQLAGAPPLLELPTDRPRPAVQSFTGSSFNFELSDSLNQQLQQLSQSVGVTPFMTFLAAFQTLLYRYTEQEDISIGAPIANRNRHEIEPLMGFFANTLVLRTDLSGNPSFIDLLKRVRQVTLGAYTHQDLPFEKLVEALQPERNTSYSPLFQVLFVFQNIPTERFKLYDLTWSWIEMPTTVARFDLSLYLEESSRGLTGKFEYNTDLFDGETIARLAEHFQILLKGVINNPNQKLSELPLLTQTEKHQLLVEWNDTSVDYPQDKCIHQLFERQVEKTPEAVAVIFEREKLTYQQLNQRANQLAHHLIELGVGADVLVGICVERSLEMLVGLLGILKAGGAYVPLDPAYPQERLAFMLEDAAVPVLLTQQKLVETLPSYQAKVLCLDSNWNQIAQQSQENPGSQITSENLIYTIYTSGSTGKPKGAMNIHKALYNRLLWMQDTYQLTVEDRVLQKTPFSFDVSVWEFFWPLLVGAGLVMARPGGHQDPTYLVKLIASQKITTLHFVPSMLQIFLEEAGLETCQSIQRVICSGEALPLALEQRFFQRINAQLHNLYGPTEAAIDITSWPCQSHSNLSTVPIGRPIANTQIYILDSYLQPVPIGVPGELHIGGINLARGYLNRPELTREKFILNPLSDSPGERLYKTGDKARYLADGTIEYIGRIDNQIKLRGFRIELGEIEAVLQKQLAVREAVVVVTESQTGDKRLVAYLVPTEKTLTIAQLRQAISQELPDYMVPSAFVMLETMPLTPNGKIDRRALPDLREELPAQINRTFVPPRTPIEELLAGIWSQVLGIKKVGIHDNFFELGGHSLLATQVMSQIRDRLEVELPLRYLFETPTIAGLSTSIETVRQPEQTLKVPPLVPVSRERELPLSFAQQRLWFLEQLEPNTATYNMPAAVRLNGQLNVEALEQSFKEIIRRHETLRTTFTTKNGNPIQVIHPAWEFQLVKHDFTGIEEQARQLEDFLLQEAARPFDLTQDLLLRASLLRLSETEYVLAIALHHIIFDGWSLGILIREFATLYEAFRAGKPSPLPELDIQYADFAAWQRKWLQGAALEEMLAYWKQQLGTNLPILQLPKTNLQTNLNTRRSGSSKFHISAKLAEGLQALGRQEGVTLFMTLLGAFQILLQRYTSQDDIVVGTDIANRNRSEIEPIIGFFVNLLVLRVNLEGNPSFRRLLKQVKEVTLGAYAHQDLPFAELVKALGGERSAPHSTPLFQVLFVLQNTPISSLELPDVTLTLLEIEPQISRFDIALFLTETEGGIEGVWQYNADLFAVEAIAQMSGHFLTLINSIVEQPDARINTLEMLTEKERERKTMKTQQQKEQKRQKFKKVKPKVVDLSQGELIKTSSLQQDSKLPLVITPNVEEVDIIDWASKNREFLETKLLHHGAIFFRDFGFDKLSDFEALAEAICPGLFANYGDLPREGVSDKIYKSTPYPSEQAILYHNESSHLDSWPQKIWFFCIKKAREGGETPIVDCRTIFQMLDLRLREIFAQKQLMYVRNYTDGLDVSWQDFFRTDDKMVVEKRCRESSILFEWKSDGGLKTKQIRPAIIKHPHTGESVFFNQIQLHHAGYLKSEVRESLLGLYGEDNLPRHVYYGDGSPIEESVIQEVLDVYQKASISEPWQQGDVLMLDNMLTAHARNPYVGDRKIAVAMANMIRSTDLKH